MLGSMCPLSSGSWRSRTRGLYEASLSLLCAPERVREHSRVRAGERNSPDIHKRKPLATRGNAAHHSSFLHFQRPPMNYSQMKDERLLAFYENVRRQVAMDAGSRYRFAGDGVRAYADKLREEMERRRMRFTPIDWHSGG